MADMSMPPLAVEVSTLTQDEPFLRRTRRCGPTSYAAFLLQAFRNCWSHQLFKTSITSRQRDLAQLPLASPNLPLRQVTPNSGEKNVTERGLNVQLVAAINEQIIRVTLANSETAYIL